MDEIELLVEETYRHFEQQFPEGELVEDGEMRMREEGEIKELLPDTPGVIYHIQKTSSIFVIRTFISRNIRLDYEMILSKPEDFPSLRLLEGGDLDLTHKLRFFLVENPHQAEIIHDHLNNRRFPIHEEMMCNLSDPGFSWWLTSKGQGFQISFNLSVTDETTVKLGPLGDQQMALKNFQALENLVTSVGLELSMQNEVNRVQFAEGEEILMEELRELFEFGVVGNSMRDLFKILARGAGDLSTLETTWFYLQELAAMRRFWIQIQYDLTPQC